MRRTILTVVSTLITFHFLTCTKIKNKKSLYLYLLNYSFSQTSFLERNSRKDILHDVFEVFQRTQTSTAWQGYIFNFLLIHFPFVQKLDVVRASRQSSVQFHYGGAGVVGDMWRDLQSIQEHPHR